MQELTFETREDFRNWLEHHHDKQEGLWLVYYKKHTGMPSIRYDEAVEEALCFGWIDSKIQTIDELRYKQVFTPRKPRSVWSELNKKRVEKMIDAGMMTSAGMKSIETSKKNGQWQRSYGNRKSQCIPQDLRSALQQNPQAWENFNNFAPSYRANYIAWINAAKRAETIAKRVDMVVERSAKNLKPGMM